MVDCELGLSSCDFVKYLGSLLFFQGDELGEGLLPGREVVAALQFQGVAAHHGIGWSLGGRRILAGRHGMHGDMIDAGEFKGMPRQIRPGTLPRVGDVINAVHGRVQQHNQGSRQVHGMRGTADLIANHIQIFTSLGEIEHGGGEAFAVYAVQPLRSSDEMFAAKLRHKFFSSALRPRHND